MKIVVWKDDAGLVVALTPPGGMTAEQAKVDKGLAPQDRPSFIVDNGDMPATSPTCWRLSDDGHVTAVADPLAYRASRAVEYPPIGDQLDAILKGGADLDALKATVATIKAEYPKPVEGGGK